MPDIFLDIETVPDMEATEYMEAIRRINKGDLGPGSSDMDTYWKCVKGSLKYTQGKVVLITYQINNAPTRRLCEWESSEKTILERLYRVLQDLQKDRRDDPLRIIGHNILCFDIFFLYNRMRILDIDDEVWLQYWVVEGPSVVDFLQMHLPLNGMSIKGLKHDVLAHAYGLPTKKSSGSDEIIHYFKGEYNKILEYSANEFIYPPMFQKIVVDGLVSTQKLAESIQRYDEMHGADQIDNI